MSRRITPLDQNYVEAHQCSIDLRMELLGHLPFFENLSNAQIQKINHLFIEVGFQSGQMIYLQGESAERLYVVADGQVKLTQLSQNGKEVLLDILKRGEFFGSLSYQPKDHYTQSAYAQTPVCILSIEGRQFRKILQDLPTVALKVMDIMVGKLRESQEMLRLISAASVEQRIATVLLQLSKKLGEKKEIGLLIQMPLSREDIANLTALTPESVSRVMSQFQKEGLIKTGRQWVAIRSEERLEELALSF